MCRTQLRWSTDQALSKLKTLVHFTTTQLAWQMRDTKSVCGVWCDVTWFCVWFFFCFSFSSPSRICCNVLFHLFKNGRSCNVIARILYSEKYFPVQEFLGSQCYTPARRVALFCERFVAPTASAGCVFFSMRSFFYQILIGVLLISFEISSNLALLQPAVPLSILFTPMQIRFTLKRLLIIECCLELLRLELLVLDLLILRNCLIDPCGVWVCSCASSRHTADFLTQEWFFLTAMLCDWVCLMRLMMHLLFWTDRQANFPLLGDTNVWQQIYVLFRNQLNTNIVAAKSMDAYGCNISIIEQNARVSACQGQDFKFTTAQKSSVFKISIFVFASILHAVSDARAEITQCDSKSILTILDFFLYSY